MVTPSDSCNFESKNCKRNDIVLDLSYSNKTKRWDTKTKPVENTDESMRNDTSTGSSQVQNQNQLYKINSRIPEEWINLIGYNNLKRNTSNFNETTWTNSNSVVRTERCLLKDVKAANLTSKFFQLKPRFSRRLQQIEITSWAVPRKQPQQPQVEVKIPWNESDESKCSR